MDYSSADVPVALAATVLVLRDSATGPEILMLRRAPTLAFHGGAWVFPGGRVDPADIVEGDPLQTARRAATREAFEEAGLTLQPEQLVPVSHWTTPVGRPRRFATWFFAAPLENGHAASVVVDGSEVDAYRWLRLDDALAAQAARDIELPPPTFVTLTVLRAFASTAEIVSFLQGSEPPMFVPRPHPVSAGVLSLYHGDAAYDGGPLDQPGPRHRLHMLETGWRYER